MSEDARSIEPLFEATFAELRALAAYYLKHERKGHTLQPTALVHEAYLRLQASEGFTCSGRIHFLNVAAAAMRRVLVDHARRKHAPSGAAGRCR